MRSLPLHQRTRKVGVCIADPFAWAKAEAGRPIRFTNPVAGSQTAGRIHPRASFALAVWAVNIAAARQAQRFDGRKDCGRG